MRYMLYYFFPFLFSPPDPPTPEDPDVVRIVAMSRDLAAYANLIGAYGIGSLAACGFRFDHMENKELIDLCDCLDRMKFNMQYKAVHHNTSTLKVADRSPLHQYLIDRIFKASPVSNVKMLRSLARNIRRGRIKKSLHIIQKQLDLAACEIDRLTKESESYKNLAWLQSQPQGYRKG